jgi:imidazolonepropionase-like amidohydrolase
MLAVKAGKLIDGTGKLSEDMVVLVEGKKIAKVGKSTEVEVPEGAQVLDASDKTVMPGMVDAHLHIRGSGDPSRRGAAAAVQDSIGTMALMSYVNAKKDLEAGFTALRDAGNFGYVDVALRDAIDEGWIEGPRLKVAGQGLTATGGHGDRTKRLAPHVKLEGLNNIVDSPDEARRATRYQIKMGVDFIKIMATLSEYVRKFGGTCSQELTYETMKAICEVAHWAGRKVGAHCHGGPGVTDAIKAGLDSLEHGRFISDEQFEMMAERGVYLVPTLSPEGRAMEHGREAVGLQKEEDWEWFLRANDAMYDTVARAHSMGVKVAAGSDAAMPLVRHGENAYELELLVRAGMTPMEAIVAATKVGSEVLDMADEIGTVEAGKYADLVVVDGNPLEDIRILQELMRIKKVIKGGQIVVSRT